MTTFLGIAAGLLLSLLGTFLTAFVVGTRVEEGEALKQAGRLMLAFLIFLVATLAGLTWCVSHWFALAFLPMLLIGGSVYSGTKQGIIQSLSAEERKLLLDYGLLMQTLCDKKSPFAPVSLLPASEDTLKGVMKKAHNDTTLPATVIDSLGHGYTFLAHFVSDDLYDSARDDLYAANAHEKPFAGSSYQKASNQVTAKMGELLLEWQQYTASNQDMVTEKDVRR